jgi:hypothetical protein
LEQTIISEGLALGFRVAPSDAAAIGRELRADGVGQDAAGMEVRSRLAEDYLPTLAQSSRRPAPPPPPAPRPLVSGTPWRAALQSCKETGGVR